MAYEIEVVHREEQPAVIVQGHVQVAEISGFLAGAFTETAQAAARAQLQFTGPPFSRYTPMAGGGFEVEAGFPVDRSASASGRVVMTSLPGGAAAHTVHQGSYEGVALAYEAIEKWLSDHDYVITGAPWECYLDEPNVPNPRTEIFFPCRPATTA